MKFKLDENLPQEAAQLFQAAGYDALTIRDQALQGALDDEVATVCQVEGRVLVTLDIGFADPRYHPQTGSPGIIVLRLKQQSKPHVLDLLSRIIPHIRNEPLASHLWIASERHLRIRSHD